MGGDVPVAVEGVQPEDQFETGSTRAAEAEKEGVGLPEAQRGGDVECPRRSPHRVHMVRQRMLQALRHQPLIMRQERQEAWPH